MLKLVSIAAFLPLLFVGAVAHAMTLDQLSMNLSQLRTVVLAVQQQDQRTQSIDTREAAPELFPAIAGAPVMLTPAQASLLRRCDMMKVPSRRCTVLKCRLAGEGCTR